eukprot:scaffold5273_cov158-Skeletonema_menzelii.AAC.21
MTETTMLWVASEQQQQAAALHKHIVLVTTTTIVIVPTKTKMNTTEMFLPLQNGATYVRIDTPTTNANAQSHHFSGDDDSNTSMTTFLLVHGGTVPNSQFDTLLPELYTHHNLAAMAVPHKNNSQHSTTTQKYRFIRMDLYGHGKSDRPRNVRHDMSLFVQQVRGVVEHFQWLDKNHKNENDEWIALGHSLGAACLVGVACYPNNTKPILFHRLILSAPMLDFMALNAHIQLLKLPCLGECIMKSVLDPFLRRRRRRRNNIQDPVLLQECFDGTSLLQMIRDGALGNQEVYYKELGEQLRSSSTMTPQVVVVWGSKDKVVGQAHIARILSLLDSPQLEIQTLHGLEHNQLGDDPQRCARAMFARRRE